MEKTTITEIASFCKRKGFVFPSGEIYGGLAGFWDYGPNGVELKENIKREWWKSFVQSREDVVGIDGSLISHPDVWVASGHVESFTDPLLDCRKCGNRIRGDQLIEDTLKKSADGLSIEEINKMIKNHNLNCPKCKGELTEARKYNLLFRTHVGPIEDETSVAYLRPETAQSIFADFKVVQETSRMKLPFGIAQMGKAFRNEISPRDFLFRSREFEMMEIEYFIHPDRINDCPYLSKEILKSKFIVYSAEDQEKNREHKTMSVRETFDKKIIKTKWHAYWLASMHKWFVDLGINPMNLRIRQHLENEKSHYALDTWDLEYKFPFGWKEIHGMANRTTFDLSQHMKHSKADLTYFDQESGKKITPYVVAEPSQGVDRAFLAFLVEAYSEKENRIVLRLHPKLAPVQVGIFPLMKKDGLPEKARELFDKLKTEFVCVYDKSGSIGRRYARQDEIGTLLCITVDYDSLKKKDVTLRERDTGKQIRVKEKDLTEIIRKLLNGEKLENFGKVIN